MRVKIKDEIYDTEIEPIMLILSQEEKLIIAKMNTANKFCSYPEEGYDDEFLRKFMQVDQFTELDKGHS